MQMNERGTRDGGGCGCQKSRLDLWLIERDTFLGWSELEKLDVRFDGTNIGGFTVIPAPRAIGYNPIVPLVFPTRCSASSSPTSNLFHEYHASARVRTILTRLALTPRSRADFSVKIQYPGIPPPVFSIFFPKQKKNYSTGVRECIFILIQIISKMLQDLQLDQRCPHESPKRSQPTGIIAPLNCA